jgi:hypothetical protein
MYHNLKTLKIRYLDTIVHYVSYIVDDGIEIPDFKCLKDL